MKRTLLLLAVISILLTSAATVGVPVDDKQQQILDQLNTLEVLLQDIRQRTISGAQVRVTSLSEISHQLGLIMAGEFRAGNGVEPGLGFTGIRINQDGIRAYNNDVQSLGFESDGDAFFGGDLSAPATTGFVIFSNDQTYNGEAVKAGDILLGDNSSGKPNIFWDVDDGSLYLRDGTTVVGQMLPTEMLGGVGTKARLDTAQAIPNVTYTDIAFETEDYDDAAFFDLATANEFTIPQNGRYQITAWVMWATDATNSRELRVVRTTGGSIEWGFISTTQALSGIATTNLVVGEVELSAGDVLVLRAWHNSGGDLDIAHAVIEIRRVK